MTEKDLTFLEFLSSVPLWFLLTIAIIVSIIGLNVVVVFMGWI